MADVLCSEPPANCEENVAEILGIPNNGQYISICSLAWACDTYVEESEKKGEIEWICRVAVGRLVKTDNNESLNIYVREERFSDAIRDGSFYMAAVRYGVSIENNDHCLNGSLLQNS